MDFIACVPARYGSTRLPGKPLLNLGGKPMVVRVADRARMSGASRVVVATDDQRIMDAVAEHGHEAVLTRSDHPTGTDRLAEVATLLDLSPDTMVINVQGDEPLIDPELIRAVAAALAEDPEAMIATAAHPLLDTIEMFNPHVVKVVLDQARRALYFSRAPIPYARDAFSSGIDAMPAGLPVLRHVGLYGYRASFLHTYHELNPCALEHFESLEQLRALWHGHKIRVHVTDRPPAPGVDTEEDWALVASLFD